MENLQNSDLVADTSIFHPFSMGVIDFRKRESREEGETRDPQQDRKTRRADPHFSAALHLQAGGPGKERNQVPTLVKTEVFPGH